MSTILENGQTKRALNIWILPFTDWGKVNDAPLVANLIADGLPKQIRIADQPYQLNVNVVKTGVNTQSVDENVDNLLKLRGQDSVDIVLGLGVASNSHSIRFEYQTELLYGGEQQYHDGEVISALTPSLQMSSTAEWRADNDITSVVAKYNQLPPGDLEECSPDDFGLSTRAGNYLCAYMTYVFAVAPEISRRAFFVHVGDFGGKMDPTAQGQRASQVSKLVSFTVEVAPLVIRKEDC